jgi:hypothetical protein
MTSGGERREIRTRPVETTRREAPTHHLDPAIGARVRIEVKKVESFE